MSISMIKRASVLGALASLGITAGFAGEGPEVVPNPPGGRSWFSRRRGKEPYPHSSTKQNSKRWQSHRNPLTGHVTIGRAPRSR